MPDATQASAIRRFGAFEINLQSGELRKKGMRLRLSGQPFQVLAVLVERPGEVVTREELVSAVLSRKFSPFDRSIDMHVSKVRKKLGDMNGDTEHIKTVRGVGYIFARPREKVKSGAR